MFLLSHINEIYEAVSFAEVYEFLRQLKVRQVDHNNASWSFIAFILPQIAYNWVIAYPNRLFISYERLIKLEFSDSLFVFQSYDCWVKI